MVYKFPTKQQWWTRNNLNPIGRNRWNLCEELEQGLKSMKNRKAAGPNGLNSELFKYGGPILSNRLLKLINTRAIQKVTYVLE